jgi:hypothetical protein
VRVTGRLVPAPQQALSARSSQSNVVPHSGHRQTRRGALDRAYSPASRRRAPAVPSSRRSSAPGSVELKYHNSSLAGRSDDWSTRGLSIANLCTTSGPPNVRDRSSPLWGRSKSVRPRRFASWCTTAHRAGFTASIPVPSKMSQTDLSPEHGTRLILGVPDMGRRCGPSESA